MNRKLLSALVAMALSSPALAQTYVMQVPAKTLKVEEPAQAPSTPATPAAPALKPGFDLSSSLLQFGQIAVGQASQSSFSVLNTGETSLDIPAPTIAGDSFLAAHSCGTLLPGTSCPVTVTFSPADPQDYLGKADVTVLNLGTKSIALKGTGLGAKFALKNTPANQHTFTSTAVGTPAPEALTLVVTNIGNQYGQMPAPTITGLNAADFSTTSTCASNNVGAGADCTVAVSFAPKAEGLRSASVKVVDTTIELNGTGLKPVVYATWDRAKTTAWYSLTNGNLQLGAGQSGTGSITQGAGARATVGKASGKWYWEITLLPGATHMMLGVIPSTVDTMAGKCTGCGDPYAKDWRIAYNTGTWSGFGAIAPTSSNYTTPGTSAMKTNGVGGGDVYGFALDMDTRTFKMYYKRAGGACEGPFATWANMPASTYYPAASIGSSAAMPTVANFGQNTYACTPPAGHMPLAQ